MIEDIFKCLDLLIFKGKAGFETITKEITNKLTLSPYPHEKELLFIIMRVCNEMMSAIEIFEPWTGNESEYPTLGESAFDLRLYRDESMLFCLNEFALKKIA